MKKVLIGAGIIGAIIVIGAAFSSNTTTSSNQQLPVLTAPINPSSSLSTETPSQKKENNAVPLSNDNYYTNSQGIDVHSPAYAPSKPAGASARCRDGTYSFSMSRRGTCSHRGGVTEWY